MSLHLDPVDTEIKTDSDVTTLMLSHPAWNHNFKCPKLL